MMNRFLRLVPWSMLALLAALLIPVFGSRFQTSVVTDILIFGLFASSLNILLGRTGLISFGHAAYFAIGAYVCAIAMKTYSLPFFLALPLAGLAAAGAALVFGYFCVRLTEIYFAMLTLAFAQIVWAICFKWNAVTGGEQGFANVPYPDMSWLKAIPVLAGMRASEHYFYLTLLVVALSLFVLRRITESPFGRILAAIRENPERAEFVGINVRRFQLAAFVIAGLFAGLAGALFGIFNRGVFPDFGYWVKSAEVLIMVILGGMGQFFGPLVGAFTLVVLNQQITSYTDYWPLVLGILLIVLLYAFPAGIMGSLADFAAFVRRRWRRDDA